MVFLLGIATQCPQLSRLDSTFWGTDPPKLTIFMGFARRAGTLKVNTA